MKKYTHLIFALLLFLMLNFIFRYPIYLCIFAFIGAMIPDLDLNFGKLHRCLFHNLWFLIIVLFLGFNFHLIDNTIAIVISMGFISHLLIDGVTPSGIYFLWPIKIFKIKGPFKTGSLNEYLIMFALLIVIGVISGII